MEPAPKMTDRAGDVHRWGRWEGAFESASAVGRKVLFPPSFRGRRHRGNRPPNESLVLDVCNFVIFAL
jgi:hypothetical protein